MPGSVLFVRSCESVRMNLMPPEQEMLRNGPDTPAVMPDDGI